VRPYDAKRRPNSVINSDLISAISKPMIWMILRLAASMMETVPPHSDVTKIYC
jgi:hypothetical protein